MSHAMYVYRVGWAEQPDGFFFWSVNGQTEFGQFHAETGDLIGTVKFRAATKPPDLSSPAGVEIEEIVAPR